MSCDGGRRKSVGQRSQNSDSYGYGGTLCGRDRRRDPTGRYTDGSRRNSICQPTVQTADEARRRSSSSGRQPTYFQIGCGGVDGRGRSSSCGRGYTDCYDALRDNCGRGDRKRKDRPPQNSQTLPRRAPSQSGRSQPDKQQIGKPCKNSNGDCNPSLKNGRCVTSTGCWEFDFGGCDPKYGRTKWESKMAEFNKKMFVGSIGSAAKAQGCTVAKTLWDACPPTNNEELFQLLKKAIVKVVVKEGMDAADRAEELARRFADGCKRTDGRRQTQQQQQHGRVPVDDGKRRERGRSVTRRSDRLNCSFKSGGKSGTYYKDQGYDVE